MGQRFPAAGGFAPVRTILATLILLAVPLAAANGPGADVQTFTQDSSCNGSSWYTSYSYWGPSVPPPVPVPTNGTNDTNGTTPPPPPPSPSDYSYGGYGYAYQHSQSCRAEADTLDAQASDGAGSLASATVYQRNSTNDSSGSSYDSSWYHDSYFNSGSDTYQGAYQYNRASSQGAEVDALGASAGQVEGCSDTFSGQGHSQSSWSSYNDGNGTSSSWQDGRSAWQGSSSDECGNHVFAGLDGHGVRAGEINSCTASFSNETTYDTYSGTDSWSYGSNDGTRSSDCRSGADATAEGEGVFAGREDACRSQSSSQSSTTGSGNETTSGSSSSFDSSHCFHGYVVEGPNGTRLSVGNETQQSCSAQGGAPSCYGYSNQGVAWTWAASPVGALQQIDVGSPVPLDVLS